MIFRRGATRHFGQPGSARDYLSDVGDGTGSSTVAAPLNWIARTFPEAPPAIWREDGAGLWEPVRKHPMLRLLRRPNPHFSGPILWMATLVDYFADGNAYWLKLRDRGGRVRELWWAPSWMMEPRGSDTEFVTHYEYRPSGSAIPVDVADVVHFRFGLDSDDPRKGRAPLKSVLREVYTDDEAANFTASLLHNMGIPGLVISPAKDLKIPPTPEDVEAAKAYFRSQFAGDRRGEPLVMSSATDVEQFGFSPEQLLLKDLRRIPEERVTAVLGIPAIVAGLGAGLDRSTFTNYHEAREAAYEQTIIPTQAVMGEELWFQLLPDFEPGEDVWDWRVGFDLSEVRVLQEDRLNLVKRLDLGVRGGHVMVSESRKAQGLPVTDRDNVYLRQMNLVEVPADGSEPRPLTRPKNLPALPASAA